MFQIMKADKMIDFMRWSKLTSVFFGVNDCSLYLYSFNQLVELGA